MKWLIRYLCVSIPAGLGWMVLGLIHFVESGDIRFLEIGAVVFVLVNAIMAIYFTSLYLEDPNIKSR